MVLLSALLLAVAGWALLRAGDRLRGGAAPPVVRVPGELLVLLPAFAPVVVRASPPPPRTSATATTAARPARPAVRRLGIRGPYERALPGEPIPVQITCYCLRGTTRRGNPVRPGIIAADPRVFPLGRRVELSIRGRSIGTFLVDDTGGVIRGAIVDVWVPDCKVARQLGRRRGVAVLQPR